MNSHDSNETAVLTGFLLGFLLGTLVGAATATLYAPGPGSETREVLGERSRVLRDRLERMAGDMQEGLTELAARARRG